MPRQPDARDVAHALAANHDTAWVGQLIEALAKENPANELPYTQAVLGVSDVELADIFGVTRQAVKVWLTNGVPTARLGAVADLASAAHLLRRKLRPERIPAAIRRPARNLNGRSLLELAVDEGPSAMYAEVVDTFDLSRLNG